MSFYRFCLVTDNDKKPKNIDDFYFTKEVVIFPKKTYSEVLEELGNAIKQQDLFDKIRIEDIALGYILDWSETDNCHGALYLNENYEDCLEKSGCNFRLLEEKINEKGKAYLFSDKKNKLNYKDLGYINFDEMLDNIKKELVNYYPKEVFHPKATKKQIRDAEARLNIKLPQTYTKFLSKISNGIILFNVEYLCSTKEVIKTIDDKYFYNTYSTVAYVKDRGEVEADKLVSFTMGEFSDASISHWVFICDNEYNDNEYPVGYITQGKRNIVHVLEGGFKEWLEGFWKGYSYGEYKSVFNILHPEWSEMQELWDYNGNNADWEPKELLEEIHNEIISKNEYDGKYEVEIEDVETKEIIKMELPFVNGSRFTKEEFEDNLTKEYRLIKFTELTNKN